MRYLSRAVGIVLALLVTAAGAEPQFAESTDSSGACSKTANAALTACRNNALDDYWISIGRCINTSARAERKDCYDEATAQLQENRDACPEQFAARSKLCDALGEARYDPPFEPSHFVDPLQIGKSVRPNRYFPLVPGSRWVYRSGSEIDTVEVIGKVKKILGVPCTVVRDVVKEGGQTIEDTTDWFAQHVDGSVWYCGELAQTFENGALVDLEGSWQAGRDLARPGIVMLASPHLGEVYRQEFLLGDAEDAARVASLTGSATVPAASCRGTCLVTHDSTPLAPGAVEHKYYAPGVGMILELDPATGERVRLVEYRIP